jgi:hypothetical protein
MSLKSQIHGIEGGQNIELLDPKQVKKILRCSLPYVYKLAEQGRLRCVRIPCPGKGTEKRRTMVRFKLNDVLDFIANHYKNT